MRRQCEGEIGSATMSVRAGGDIPLRLFNEFVVFASVRRVFIHTAGATDASFAHAARLVSELDGPPRSVLLISDVDLGSLCLDGEVDDSLVIVADHEAALSPLPEECFAAGTHWLLPRMPITFPLHLRLDSMFFTVDTTGKVVTIKEWFKIKFGRLQTRPFGVYSNSKLEVDRSPLWERRADLGGVPLELAVVLAPPAVMAMTRDEKGNIKDVRGVVPDLFASFAEVHNVTIGWVRPEDGKLGSHSGGGSWSGVIGMLQRGEADMSGIAVVETIEKHEAVGFAWVSVETKSTLVLARPDASTVNIGAFLRIFGASAWLAIFATIFVIGCFGTLLVKFLTWRNLTGPHCTTWLGAYSAGFSFAYGALLQRDADGSLLPAAASSKVLLVSVSVLCLVLHGYFGAVLTSFMTAGDNGPEFHSYHDVITNDYNLVLWKYSAEVAELKNAPEGSGMRRVFEERGKNFRFLPSIEHVKEYLLSSSDRVAFSGITFNFEGDDRFRGLTGMEDVRVGRGSIMLRKGSEFLRHFNHHMLKTANTGLFKFWVYKWFTLRRPPRRRRTGQGDEAKALGYDNMAFPAVVVAIGISASVFLAGVEWMLLRVSYGYVREIRSWTFELR